MKKAFFAIAMMVIFGIIVMGCATKGDLEKMQAQQQQTDLKADQALKASQQASEAAMKASQAADQKADQALQTAQQANEAAKTADQKAQAAEAQVEAAKANNTFKQSMKK